MSCQNSKLDALLIWASQPTVTRELKKQHCYVIDLIATLHGHSAGLSRPSVLTKLRERRRGFGYVDPPAFTESVEIVFHAYRDGSAAYLRRGARINEALFYCPGGGGSGIWAVDSDRAEAWLTTKIMCHIQAGE